MFLFGMVFFFLFFFSHNTSAARKIVRVLTVLFCVVLSKGTLLDKLYLEPVDVRINHFQIMTCFSTLSVTFQL